MIDTHVHPALFSDICQDKDKFRLRCDEMGFHLMKPVDLDLLKKQYDLGKVEKVVLLPQDCSTECGTAVISNEEIKLLVDLRPDYFIGFASVDPRREDAVEVLEKAFKEYGLSGLKLNTAKLKLYPNHEKLLPLYDLCVKYNKPVIFHSGLCWEPNTLTKYAHPLEFEEVALRYPSMKICLAHFGWPWVQDTAALLIKHENVYANTAMLYMDSPELFFEKVFKKDMGEYWLEHNFADKVMFGSNAPRFRPVRMRRGLESLNLKEKTMKKILRENAIRFLGLEE
jgi:uncharacterized protein